MRMRFASALTNDEDRSIDFWVDKLGFKLMFDNPTEWGGRFLAFMPPGGGTWFVMSKPIPGVPAQGLEGTYETLKAKGVEFPQPPTRRSWGGIEAKFQDSDGNVFLLQQGASPFSEKRRFVWTGIR